MDGRSDFNVSTFRKARCMVSRASASTAGATAGSIARGPSATTSSQTLSYSPATYRSTQLLISRIHSPGRYPADRQAGGEQRGDAKCDRLTARGAFAHERSSERHRHGEREPIKHVHAVRRRATEHQHEQTEHALRDGGDRRDGDRAAEGPVRPSVAYPLDDGPEAHERVIKDERISDTTMQREHEIHRPKS